MTDALEAALRTAFDRETLAVYADRLQAQGDPRGELIGIELHADRHGMSPASHARRGELLVELLGDLATHPAIVCSYGFVDLVGLASMAVLDTFLFGPFSTYLRSATLRGTSRPRSRHPMTAQAAHALVIALAARSRPWLTTLELLCPSSVRIPRKLAALLVSRTPRVERLAVSGHDVWPAVPYPGVRQLRITRFDAIPALIATGTPPSTVCFPDVVELELEPAVTYPPLAWNQQRALLPPAQLPSLRTLDLSRGTPGFDVFRCLRHLAIVPQLETLRLADMRTEADLLNVQATLDRMPKLSVFEIRGGHQHLRDALRHPTAEIIRRRTSE